MVRPVSSFSLSMAMALGMLTLALLQELPGLYLYRTAGQPPVGRPRPGTTLRSCIAHAQISVGTRLPESPYGVAHNLHFGISRSVAELSALGPPPLISDTWLCRFQR